MWFSPSLIFILVETDALFSPNIIYVVEIDVVPRLCSHLGFLVVVPLASTGMHYKSPYRPTFHRVVIDNSVGPELGNRPRVFFKAFALFMNRYE